MTVGPRIWKTGLAVVLSIWLSDLLGFPSIMAVVATVLSMQPTIARSFTQGRDRAIATAIGGIIGFSIIYFVNTDPILVGLAVVITILVCLKMKLQNVIPLTVITTASVMINVTDPSYIYVAERLAATFIGIAVAVLVNILFAPPKMDQELFVKIQQLNYQLKAFYVKVLSAFIAGKGYDEQAMDQKIVEIRDSFEEARKCLFDCKEGLGFRWNKSNDRVKMYENIFTSLNLVFERICGIYNTERNRAKRNLDLTETTAEYQEIIKIIKQLLTTTVSIQDNLIAFLTTRDNDLQNFILTKFKETKEMALDLKEKIGQWYLVTADQGDCDVSSLVEIANIGYEITEIINFLERIVTLYKENKTEFEMLPPQRNIGV